MSFRMKNLKSLIYSRGKSQWQICRTLNWPEAKLSRFVTGRRQPTLGDLKALAGILGLHLDDIQRTLQQDEPAIKSQTPGGGAKTSRGG
jgi:transcriptional regulator with XRE-family HTH domain